MSYPASPQPQPGRRSNPRRRLIITGAAVTLALTGVAARLGYVQVQNPQELSAQAENQRVRTATLTADRGEILDRNGAMLAQDVHLRGIYADPSMVKDAPATARTLASLLKMPAGDVEELLRKPGRFVYLAHKVTPQVADRIDSKNLEGIGILPEQARQYPAGRAGASVVGFTNAEGAGAGGLESRFNSDLQGKDGSVRVEADPSGHQIPLTDTEESAAVPGRSIQSTLDRDLTYKAQQALDAQVKLSHAKGGAAVTMDVQTGEILAIATSPTYNPNDLSHASPDALGNRAFTTPYEPGSVSKAVLASAAIDEGIASPDTVINLTTALRVGGHTFTDDEPLSGPYTFTGVIAKSSNIGSIKMAQELADKTGPDTLYRYMKKFGYGEATGANFPGESRGQLVPPSQWSTSQKANVAIGYGLTVTPVQMASVYATIANGGVRVTPHVVKAVSDGKGGWKQLTQPSPRRVISQNTAQQVTTMLEAVMNEGGTAGNTSIPGYILAGKTGTARKVQASCGCYRGYNATFVGFAPADKPRLVTLVTIDDPVGAHYGSTTAAPVFQPIMTFALQSLGIAPTGARPRMHPLRP